MAGGGRMEFKGGNYTATAQLNVGDALKEAFKLDDALRKIGNTLSALAKGNDISAFWDEQAASITKVKEVFDRFARDVEAFGDRDPRSIASAENLIKTMNAFSAWHPDDKIENYFRTLGEGAQDLTEKAQKMAIGLDAAFSKNQFADHVQVFKMMRDSCEDAVLVIERLKQGDLGALREQYQGAQRDVENLKAENRGLYDQIRELKSSTGFSDMRRELSNLRDATRANKEEFRDFLKAAGFDGSDLDSWGRFQQLFEDIERGTRTLSQAQEAVRNAFPEMFNVGATVDQIGAVNQSLMEMKQLLASMSGGGGTNGPFSGGGSGGQPDDYDDKLQQIINHLEQINSGLQQVSQTLGSLGSGGENKILTIVEAMQQLVQIINELNAKEFSVTNVLQANGASDGANAIRIYGEEARALNEYLIRLSENFTNVVNTSRGMTGVLLTMSDEFAKLDAFNPTQITKSLSDPKMTTEGIVTITGQLREFREAFMALVNALHERNVEVPLPDDARLQAAEASVRAFDEQSRKLTETFVEEAANAAAASNGIQQVAAQTAELKIDTPTAGESFDLMIAKIEEILAMLPQIQTALQTAFDISQHQQAFATIVSMFNALQQNAMAAAAKLETMRIPDTLVNSLTTVQELLRNIGQQSTGSVSGMVPTFAQGSLDTLRAQLISALQEAARQAQLTVENIGVSDQALDTLRTRIEAALQNINITAAGGIPGNGGAPGGPGNGGGGNGGGPGGPGNGGGGDNIAFLRQLIQLHEQINVWIERNADAYARNQNAVDAFVVALQDAVGQQQATIDQWITDLEQSGTVTEETVQQLRTAWEQIRGLSNEMNAQQEQMTRWENAVRRAGETFDGLVAKMAGRSQDTMFGGDPASIQQYNAAMTELENRLNALQTATADQRDTALQAFNDQVHVVRNLTTELNNLARSQATEDAWAESIRRAGEAYDKIIASTQGKSDATLFGGDIGRIQRYNAAVTELQNRLVALQSANAAQRQTALQSFREQESAVRNLWTTLNNTAGAESASTALSKQIDTFRKQLIAFNNSHSRFYQQNKATLDDMFTRLSDGSIRSSDDLKVLQAEFTRLSGTMTAAGSTGKTFFQLLNEGWRKFGGWSLVTRSFTMAIRTMKQAVTAVKEVDAAMTELRKVTDLTAQGYEKFSQDAVRMAVRVGSKLSDAINATAD